MNFIAKLLDANTLGGWVRAGVAAGFGVLVAKSSFVAAILTPEMQDMAAVLASGIVVGVWSQIAKKFAA